MSPADPGVSEETPGRGIRFRRRRIATCQGLSDELSTDFADEDTQYSYLRHRPNQWMPYAIISLGSAISPLTALAATVSGLARKTRASLWPMRPGKLRLVVLMQLRAVLSRPKVSDGPPRQAAQLGWPILAPADRNTSSKVWLPSRSVFNPAAISLVAGTTNVSIRTA